MQQESLRASYAWNGLPELLAEVLEVKQTASPSGPSSEAQLCCLKTTQRSYL